MASEWECGAYGPGGLAVGAACFIADRYERVCPSAAACRFIMTEERQRLWDLIHDKAAAGDPDFIVLARSFTTPDMLLGGAASGPLADG